MERTYNYKIETKYKDYNIKLELSLIQLQKKLEEIKFLYIEHNDSKVLLNVLNIESIILLE